MELAKRLLVLSFYFLLTLSMTLHWLFPLSDSAKLISFTTPAGLNVQAFYKTPPYASRPYTAIIYHHGRLLRGMDYKHSATLGYNIQDFVNRLALDGYAVIAPLRDNYSDEAVLRDINDGAVQYLLRQKDVLPMRMGVVGYSLGGNPSYLIGTQTSLIKAVVLISPVIFEKFLIEENARKNKVPMLILYGKKDLDSVLKTCESSIVPHLKKHGHKYQARIQFDVEHKWFMKVRPEFWSKVEAFLHRFLPVNN